MRELSAEHKAGRAGDQPSPGGFPSTLMFHSLVRLQSDSSSKPLETQLLSFDTCLSKGLNNDMAPLKLTLCFWSRLWSRLAEESKREGIQAGLLDGTYGNYSLIHHLGHGNSCK